MNEWELQHLLTERWRRNKFEFDSEKFDLVCWELMFPSWTICDKNHTWREKSVDFIFYSQMSHRFLVCEIKNIIKGRKDFLSAYCQTIERTCCFTDQYSVHKIENAMKECYHFAINERGGVQFELPEILFPTNPKIEMLLLAIDFPKKSVEEFEIWNTMSFSDLRAETNKYATNKEFNRFQALTTNDIHQLHDRKVKKMNIQL